MGKGRGMLRSWQFPQSPTLVFHDIDFCFLEHKGCTVRTLQSIRSFSGLAGGLCSSRVLHACSHCLFSFLFPKITQLLPQSWARYPEGYSPFSEWRRQSYAKGLGLHGSLQGFECLGIWLIVKVNKIFDTSVPVLLRSCSL